MKNIKLIFSLCIGLALFACNESNTAEEQLAGGQAVSIQVSTGTYQEGSVDIASKDVVHGNDSIKLADLLDGTWQLSIVDANGDYLLQEFLTVDNVQDGVYKVPYMAYGDYDLYLKNYGYGFVDSLVGIPRVNVDFTNQLDGVYYGHNKETISQGNTSVNIDVKPASALVIMNLDNIRAAEAAGDLVLTKLSALSIPGNGYGMDLELDGVGSHNIDLIANRDVNLGFYFNPEYTVELAFAYTYKGEEYEESAYLDHDNQLNSDKKSLLNFGCKYEIVLMLPLGAELDGFRDDVESLGTDGVSYLYPRQEITN